jgi:hypothetical protein
MSSDDPDVPVRCPECAQIDPELADELADLVAEDTGLLE